MSGTGNVKVSINAGSEAEALDKLRALRLIGGVEVSMKENTVNSRGGQWIVAGYLYLVDVVELNGG